MSAFFCDCMLSESFLLALFQGPCIIMPFTTLPCSIEFDWDGVDFLHSSSYSPMLWICVQDSANMEVF